MQKIVRIYPSKNIRSIRKLIDLIDTKLVERISNPTLFIFEIQRDSTLDAYLSFIDVRASFEDEINKGSIEKVETTFDRYFTIHGFTGYQIRYIHVVDEASGWYHYYFHIWKL